MLLALKGHPLFLGEVVEVQLLSLEGVELLSLEEVVDVLTLIYLQAVMVLIHLMAVPVVVLMSLREAVEEVWSGPMMACWREREMVEQSQVVCLVVGAVALKNCLEEAVVKLQNWLV